MPERFESADQIANQFEVNLSELSDTTVFAREPALNTAKPLPSLPGDATKAVVCVEGQDVRWRPDGDTTAPTAAIGMVLPAGSTTLFAYGNAALVKLRFIETAPSATISVVYGE